MSDAAERRVLEILDARSRKVVLAERLILRFVLDAVDPARVIAKRKATGFVC